MAPACLPYFQATSKKRPRRGFSARVGEWNVSLELTLALLLARMLFGMRRYVTQVTGPPAPALDNVNPIDHLSFKRPERLDIAAKPAMPQTFSPWL
jgi:hypothetical protein